jgi:ankyrin repeat protein
MPFLLITKNLSIDIGRYHKMSLPGDLYRALEKGDNPKVDDLINSHGGFTKVVNDNGSTAIHIAARQGNIPVLQTIWKKWKPPIGQKMNNGWTPLHAGNMGCKVSKGGIQN